MLKVIAQNPVNVTCHTTFYGDTTVNSIADDVNVCVLQGTLCVEESVGNGVRITQSFGMSPPFGLCYGFFCKFTGCLSLYAQPGVTILGTTGEGVRIHSGGSVSFETGGNTAYIRALGNVSADSLGQYSYIWAKGSVHIADRIHSGVTIDSCAYLTCLTIGREVSVTSQGGVFCTSIAERCSIHALENISTEYVGKFSLLKAANISCRTQHELAQLQSNKLVIVDTATDVQNPIVASTL